MSQPIAREVVVAGQRAVVLESARLRVTVLPELGGHVVELVDRASDVNLLWHNPRTAPRPAPYGAHFDDWWSGGWDEIFPSGDRGTLHGELLPYMGELWCVPWTAEGLDRRRGGRHHRERLRDDLPGPLRAGDPLLGDEPVPRRLSDREPRCPAAPVHVGDPPRLRRDARPPARPPGRQMLVGVSSDPSMGGRVDGPLAGPARSDARRAVPGTCGASGRREEAVFAGHWATDLAAGWLALTDTAARRGVAIAFDARSSGTRGSGRCTGDGGGTARRAGAVDDPAAGGGGSGGAGRHGCSRRASRWKRKWHSRSSKGSTGWRGSTGAGSSRRP